MKKVLQSLLIIVAVTFPHFELAAKSTSPWKWKLSLKGDTAVNSIVQPSSLYVDASRKRYYVVDTGNNRLVSFDFDGKFISAFNAEDKLKTPADFVRGEGKDLWVLEKGRNSLTKIDLKSKTTTPFILKHKGRLVYPSRLERSNNFFYVLDKASGAVLAFDSNMKVRKSFKCPECKSGLIDFKIRGDTLWGMDQKGKTIHIFYTKGKKKGHINLEAETMSFPYSFAIDKSGLVYVLDRHEGNVAVFTKKGNLKYRFLGYGHVREKLYYPAEIKFDSMGRLCIVDEGNGRVEIFSR